MTDKKRRSLERALAIASEEFMSQPFDEVSVTSIARRAHCSTNTLYDAFEGKEGLFLQALSYRMTNEHRPQLAHLTGRPALHSLLAFTETRIRYLASLKMRAAFRVLATQSRLVKPVLPRFMRHAYSDLNSALSEVARSCIAEGTLRRLEPEVIAYDIIAVSSYEPQTFGVLYGDETSVDAKEVLRRIFIPLVSPAGNRQLRAYLRQEPGESPQTFASDRQSAY